MIEINKIFAGLNTKRLEFLLERELARDRGRRYNFPDAYRPLLRKSPERIKAESDYKSHSLTPQLLAERAKQYANEGYIVQSAWYNHYARKNGPNSTPGIPLLEAAKNQRDAYALSIPDMNGLLLSIRLDAIRLHSDSLWEDYFAYRPLASRMQRALNRYSRRIPRLEAMQSILASPPVPIRR